MAYTKAQAALFIARSRGMVGEDETPSAATQTHMEEMVSLAIKTLSATGVRFWDSSEDSIADEYMIPLSEWVDAVVAFKDGQISLDQAEFQKRAALRGLSAVAATAPLPAVVWRNY